MVKAILAKGVFELENNSTMKNKNITGRLIIKFLQSIIFIETNAELKNNNAPTIVPANF